MLKTVDTNKDYLIRVESKTLTGVALIPPPYRAIILVNNDSALVPAFEPFTLSLKTDKRIIPLYYSLLINCTVAPVVRMYTPYFGIKDSGGVPVPKNVTINSKINPYVSIHHIDPVNPTIDFQYTFLWNQVKWNDADFLETSGGLMIDGEVNYSDALINTVNLYGPGGGFADITISLVYAELQR